MARRTRYQQGSVQRGKRQNGPDVWVFRWREIGPNGKNVQRKAVIGTVINLPSEASAMKAAQALRIDANQQTPRAVSCPSTIADLIEHFRLKELTEDEQGRMAHSTRAAYEFYLNRLILPRWCIL